MFQPCTRSHAPRGNECGKRLGFEVKYTDTPKVAQSLLIAQQDLNIDELVVVYPGQQTFPLHNNIRAVGLVNLH